MPAFPDIDPASPLQFVINAAAGSSDAQAKREVIEAALRAGGRRGDLLFCSPAELSGVAQQAATRAIADRKALVAVGGDGTLNTVAQAAHAVGCAMGGGLWARSTTLRGHTASPGCCLIEQWDFSTADQTFSRTQITEIRPARA